MALKIIKQTDLAEMRAEEVAKEQRIADLELALADQVAAYADLCERQRDVELLLADIVAQGGV